MTRIRHAHDILAQKYPQQMMRLAGLQKQIATSMLRSQSTEDMVAVEEDELDKFMNDPPAAGWGKESDLVLS